MREDRNNCGNRDVKGRCITYCALVAMNSLSALAFTAGGLTLKESHNQAAAIALIVIGGIAVLFCNGIPLIQFLCRSRHRLNANNEVYEQLDGNVDSENGNPPDVVPSNA